MSSKIVPGGIKTNLITGFLGAGKTSCLQHLMKHKPAGERWAILVNEFGEVGIDGELLAGHPSDQVFIRELAGGCLCCTMGLPMQIALNQLLAASHPDRLLIELTGLGHAREVLQLLSQPWYQELLQLRATVMILDGRQHVLSRIESSPLFHNQLALADICLINKQDLSTEAERREIAHWLQQRRPEATLYFTEQAALPIAWLDRASAFRPPEHPHKAQPTASSLAADEATRTLPEQGYLRSEQQRDGFYTTGWRFAGHLIFDQDLIQTLLESLTPLRMKAVFNTDRGCLSVNLAESMLQSSTGPGARSESRLEIIDTRAVAAQQIEERLLRALTQRGKQQ